MGDMEEVKRRIQKRKYKKRVIDDDNYYSEQKSDGGVFNKLYKRAIRFMVLVVLILGFLTFVKLNPKNEFVRSVFNDNFDFSSMNEYIDNTIGSIIPFFNLDNILSVSADNKYELIDGNYFRNDSSNVVNISSGVVTEVGSNELIGDFVKVTQDNGIVVTYGKLVDIDVSLYDRLKAKEIIGKFDQKVFLVFEKDAVEISYEDAIKD